MGKKIMSFKDNNNTPRENLLKILILMGMIVSVIAFIEDLLILNDYRSSLILFIFFMVLVFCHLIIIKGKKFFAAEIIIGLTGNLLFFPAIFIFGGGLGSGASVWLVLGLFYIIGMFKGKLCVILIALTVMADSVTMIFTYLNPDKLTSISRAGGYVDTFFAVFAVGMFLGIINKVMLNNSKHEKEKVEQQKAEIEKLSDARTGFFSNMSHEIRTPINTIIGLDEMILRDQDCSDEIKSNALLIQNSSKMLLSMVNNVLDFSKMYEGRLELYPVKYNLKGMLYDIISIIDSQAREKNLEFELCVDRKCPSELYGDDKRIKQVLLNVLTNAIRYTKEGKVTFTLNCEILDNDKCRLSFIVSDTGIGIKSENISRIFNAFSRVADDDTDIMEGTGLGLAISRQLLNLMGGRISVDSIYTKGSTFTVNIEQKVENAEPVGKILLADLGRGLDCMYRGLFVAPEARVLVVDDNKTDREVICKLLKDTRVQIDQAQNGIEALNFTKHKYYDVILMDYMMPGMNGLETLEKIRRQENGFCRDSSVIGMTAIAQSELLDNNINARYDAIIEKPFGCFTLETTMMGIMPSSIFEVIDREAGQYTNFELENMSSNMNQKSKLMITTDSVCDLPEYILAEYGMRQAYMYINTPRGRFRDTKEIDVNNVLDSENINNFTGTALTVEDYEKFFAECLTEADEVLHIALGKNMGKSYHNACSAAECFDNVHVVDSGQLSCGLGMMVIIEGIVKRQGASVEELIKKVESAQQEVYTSFLSATTDCLFRYGYANRFTRFLGKTFHLHPILTVRNSGIKVSGFLAGDIRKAYLRFIKHTLRRYSKSRIEGISVSHAGLNAAVQESIEKCVKDMVDTPVFVIQQTSVTNACIAGVGTMGISFAIRSKENKE